MSGNEEYTEVTVIETPAKASIKFLIKLFPNFTVWVFLILCALFNSFKNSLNKFLCTSSSI